jgi:glucokinase
MLLGGDVGGTKTYVGLFTRADPRPAAIDVRSYRTLDFNSLTALLHKFLEDARIDVRKIHAACIGVAGPVVGRRARLTNIPWEVDADAICRDLPLARAQLLNDLEAMAWCIPILREDEIAVLRRGAGRAGESAGAALMAAGTGLGVAVLPRIDGRLVVLPSEGGHSDFAPRTPDELTLMNGLVRARGRAELEQILSGPGLVNIHRFVYPHRCPALNQPLESPDFPELITRAGLTGECADCRKTLELFVSIYGAAAGNLALITLATAGIFLGGGIAPKILPALRWPVFEEAFCAKAPMDGLMRTISVSVILNPQAALIGAAACANSLG